MRFVLPAQKLIPNHPDYDAFLDQRWLTAVKLGGTVTTTNGQAALEIHDANADLVTLQDIEATVAAGGEVFGMPGFLEIAASAIDHSVPNTLRDSANRTWKTYHNEFNEIRQDASGNWWLSTNPFGYSLTGSEILAAHAAYGVNFRTAADYKAAFPDSTP